MAIYTRFGSVVTLTDARLIPVWVEHCSGEIKWHYTTPTKMRRGAKIEEMPIWHYRGKYADNGTQVCDGKWVCANDLRADGGWKEIQSALSGLCPAGEKKFQEWNRAGAPGAAHFFPPIEERLVA